MTWWTGVPPDRRTEFMAELQRRLDGDQVPYRVGRARYRGGLVFRCQVKGRDRRARQERTAAFEQCSVHEQLLRLEMFGQQPDWPVVREALALMMALLSHPACGRRTPTLPGDQPRADQSDAAVPSVERQP